MNGVSLADPPVSLWVCCRYNGATEVLKLPVSLGDAGEGAVRRRLSSFACPNAEHHGQDKLKFGLQYKPHPGKARLDANEREIDSDSLY